MTANKRDLMGKEMKRVVPLEVARRKVFTFLVI